jgi:hypothetical protein
MRSAEYIANCVRTECGYGPVVERLAEYPVLADHLLSALASAVQIGNAQDRLKKAIFYGKKEILAELAAGEASGQAQAIVERIQANPAILRLIHGIVGKLTEAGELEEQLLKVLGGAAADVVNIAEEIGDSNWYDGILGSALGLDLDLIRTQNIDKLRARYPEKFSEQRANVRDLDREREVLETHHDEKG